MATAPPPNLDSDSSDPQPKPHAAPRSFWSAAGPGIVAGAADDDPAGITTYSIAGAQFGTGLLWTALITWPLMAAVQSMCARVGMVTGRGLIGAVRTRFPRSVVVGVAFALFAANSINVGADLAAMADAAEVFSSIHSRIWILVLGGGIAWATVHFRYVQIANALKWLALSLFAYIIAGISLKPHWGQVLQATVIPTVPVGGDGWATLVAIFGTTISPYLFFWQASQEVDEKRASGQREVKDRRGATPQQIRHRKIDIGIGTFFSNLVMFFVILTCALTLHREGITTITSSREAAEALRPIAGHLAATLYAGGILAVGLLAIPTLTASAAYALAETFGWREGLDAQFREAPAFYAVVILATAVGMGLDFLNVNPVHALFWTGVINGVLAPVLIFGLLAVASDRHAMGGQPSSLLGRVTVGVTGVLMVGAVIGMVVF